MTQAEWRLWVLERQLGRIFFGKTGRRVCFMLLAGAAVYFIVRFAVAIVTGK